MNRKKLSTGILILAFLLLAVGAGVLYFDYRDRHYSDNLYESLAELAKEPEESVTAPSETQKEKEETYVSPIAFDELKKINPDIVGWIRIADTSID